MEFVKNNDRQNRCLEVKASSGAKCSGVGHLRKDQITVGAQCQAWGGTGNGEERGGPNAPRA